MNDYITIALPKGKLFRRSRDLLAQVGWDAEGVSEDSRKLVLTNEEKKIRFMSILMIYWKSAAPMTSRSA